MITKLREDFNNNFSKDQYELFLEDLNSKHPGAIRFRIAETPIFISAELTKKIIDTCESIVDIIVKDDFKELTDRSIPIHEKVQHENSHSHFIAFDFGICEDDAGNIEPQLIEMQGFPTLFGFQVYYPEIVRKHFSIPENYDNYLNHYDKNLYINLLKEIIVGDYETKEVVLLELKPEEQKTLIDFYCTQDYLNIPILCISDLIKDEKKLYYLKDGEKVQIKRIYNRIIFDDLSQQKEELGDIIDITDDLEVEWIPHPNWFYRISKFTMPFIDHAYVPKTYFLNELEIIPEDLENYVLKPLFSFAGQGVIIDLVRSDIDAVKDPENWILQRKVKYASIVKTPDEPAKAEIRIFYFWKDGWTRPIAVNNLARLSKGKMIGVRYNADKEWVGGSVAFFEKYL